VAPRTILHADMDAFFAAVEVLDDPRLRGRPVIVGGTPEGRGVVAAASYEARRYGVHSAMSAARARRLCPHGVFLRPRPERYLAVSRRVFAIFHEFTPLVEPLSVDEAFLDVTGSRDLWGDGPAIARRLKRRVREETGLTVSVGVAPNKLLAKLASDLEKPDGLTVVPERDTAAWLAPLPVERLWGVGRRTAPRLRALGIATFGDLQRADPDRLRRALGPVAAVRLPALARGEDDRPVVTDREAKSIGNEVTFAQDIGDPAELRSVLDALAEKVAWRLRRAGVTARVVQVKARFPDFTTVTRRAALPHPTDRTAELRDAARRLLAKRVDRRGRPLRLLGVTAQELAPAAVQEELFPDPRDRRRGELDRVLDAARARFGEGRLTLGIRRKPTGEEREG